MAVYVISCYFSCVSSNRFRWPMLHRNMNTFTCVSPDIYLKKTVIVFFVALLETRYVASPSPSYDHHLCVHI